MIYYVISVIILIITQMLAFIIHNGDVLDMNTEIIIALIGVAGSILIAAGGIWTQVVQFKKDAQRIEGVNKTANDVKSDTSEIKPKISNIEKYTFELRDNMIKKNERVDMAIDGIGELINRQRADDLMKQKISIGLENPMYVQSMINLVYEKNAELNMMVKKLSEEKILLDEQVHALLQENEQLNAENKELKKTVKKFDKQHSKNELRL